MNPKEKKQLLKLADIYFRDNKYSFVKNILDKVIKVDSNNSKANELLGYIYANSGEFDVAFRLLNAACLKNDCSPEALYYLGSMQLKRGFFDLAIETFKKSILKGGEFYEVLHDLATAQANIGDVASSFDNYQKCLIFNKASHELFFNIALTLFGLKRYDEAIDHYDRALNLKPDYAEAWSNKGGALSKLKRYDEAIDHYDRALSLKPDYAEAWSNKGVTLNDLKRYDEAIDHYDRALNLKPDSAEAWSNKGVTLNELKRYDEAIDHYDRALNLKSDYAEAWSNKGGTLNELKRYDEAIDHYDRALNIKPDYAGAWCNKGGALSELKRYDEAIDHYDRALNLKPDYAEAWSNKGVTLNDLKRYDEAIDHYNRALNLKPDYAEAWSSKGVTLSELKRYNEAIDHYDRALNLKPDYAEAWSNKGGALSELKRYDEAIEHYDRALSLKPDMDWILGALISSKMNICDWSGLTESLKNILKKVAANEKVINPFALLALSDDPFLSKKCSEIFTQKTCPENPALGTLPKAGKKDRIRIAYFSPDFRNHPVSFLTAELFEIHDRSRFEVIAFSLHKASIDDEMNMRLREGFDRFIDVDNMSDLNIAKLARELEVDIAIDLTGHTQYSRTKIFSYRAAPIQVNWLGYPGTMGADFIDYIVADKTIIPEEYQKFYSEKVVLLPHSYIIDDSKRIASFKVFKREESGLPEKAVVFCCFNNDYKLNPQVLDSWSRILTAAENSVLWITEKNDRYRVNLIIEFQKRGIDSTRIIFAPRVALMADYMARNTLADLFLDTSPYNAHTTALDSIKAGVPVLTLKGQSFSSRVAASILNTLGLPELITTTQEEYETLAIDLANNSHKLLTIRKKLVKNSLSSPLFDTPLFTKNLEAAYLKMMEQYQSDLQPRPIFIV